jgi:hypothetical protein
MKKKIITARSFQNQYRKKLTEEQEQSILCKWIKVNYPDVLFTVDLGGIKLSQHQKRIMSTRCKKGHPDLMIQEWYKDKFCGLAIEFKRTGVKVSKADGTLRKDDHLKKQLSYIMALRSRCWLACFVSGVENAKEVIKLYLEGDSLEKINKKIYPKI